MTSFWLYFKLSARFWRTHYQQYLLLMSSVLIGIFGYALNDILITNAKKQLNTSQQHIHQMGTHQLMGFKGYIEPAQYAYVRNILGLHHSVPIIERQIDIDGSAVQVIGFDPISINPENVKEQVEGGPVSSELYKLLYGDNNILVTPRLEPLLEKTNQYIQIANKSIRVNPVEFINHHDYADSLIIFADLHTMSKWVGSDNLDRIILNELNLDKQEALNKIGLMVKTTDQQLQFKQQLTKSLYINLTAASLIALVVAFSLIYSSLHFLQSQKQPIIRQFNAIGVDANSIRLWLWLEILFIISLVSVLGLFSAYHIGDYLQPKFTQLLNYHYYSNTEYGLGMNWGTILRASTLTLLTLVVAYIFAQRDMLSSKHEKSKYHVPLIMITTIAFIYLFVTLQTGIVGGFIAIGLWLLLLAFLTPIVSRALISRLTTKKMGAINLIASKNLIYRFKNLNIAVITLTITLSLIISLSIMIYSFRQNTTAWITQRLTSDVYLTNVSKDELSSSQGLYSFIDSNHDIKYASNYLNILTVIQDVPAEMYAVSFKPYNYSGYDFIEPISDSDWQSFNDERAVFISEPLHQKLSAPTHIKVDTKEGVVKLKVLNVYRDFGSEHGVVLMSDKTYQSLYGDYVPQTFGIKLKDKKNSYKFINEVKAQYPDVKTWKRHDIINLTLEIFDSTFSILVIVRALLVVVALLGIISAFLVLQFEHTILQRQLQALGANTREVLRFYCLQSGIVGLICLILSIPGGLLCGQWLLTLVQKRAFGWHIDYTVPWPEIFILTGFVFGLMIIAGIVPALMYKKSTKVPIIYEHI